MRLWEHEKKLRLMFMASGIDSPELCARILVAHAAKLNKIDYILAHDSELNEQSSLELNSMALRRAQGEPLAYILGKKEFFGMDFFVDASTLIPRPETELLVESALNIFPDKPISYADICCGCGCIGLTLKKYRPDWRGLLIDISGDALKITQKNASQLNLQVDIIEADIFNLPLKKQALDLIVCNPPYISHADKAQVMTETLAYEPHCALFSDSNGFAHLWTILKTAIQLLKPNGWLILEHGCNQGTKIKMLFKRLGFVKIRDYPDLAGLPRCALAQKGE